MTQKSSSGPAPRGRGRPSKSASGPLYREKIIAEALEMTRSSESEPLTFRALGARLGVDPAALYRHIPSKDGLLLAVADGIINEAIQGYQETGAWRDDLTELLGRVHGAYMEHPQVAVSAVTRVTRLEAEMQFTETILRILERTGLPPSEAVLVYRSLEDSMLAWTGFRAQVDLLPNPEAERIEWEQAYLLADAEIYPRVVRQASAMTEVSLIEAFRASLALLLDGLELRIRATAHSSPPTSTGEGA